VGHRDVHSSGRNAPDHCRPLETQTPTVDANVLREPHGLEHLGTEHPAVANFNPLLQHRVIRKDFEGRLQKDEIKMCSVGSRATNLCVRVVRGLEADLVEPQLGEENAHKACHS
jgi:hypothetical protein